MITKARKIARDKARELSVKPKPKPSFNLPPRKCWGKAGHVWANLIAQAKHNGQQFEDHINYAL